MMKRKKCLADGGKLPNDYAEAALRRSQAKYGNAVPPTDSPQQQRQDRVPQQQAIGSVGQAMLDAIRNRDEQLRKAADYDQPRKFAGGGMPGVIREGNSFRGDPTSPALTLQMQSEDGGLAATATPNVAAVQAVSPVSTPLSGATQAIPAPGIVTAPPGMGNVLNNPSAGNVFNNPSAGNVTAPAGGAQTFAERSIAAGINPNAAYRAGGPGDPHASGGLAATAAQRVAGANAAATSVTANQQAPQLDNPMDTISTRQRRQTRTPGLRDGGSVGYRRGNEFSDRPMTGTIGTQSRDPVATTPKPAQKMDEPVYPQERSQMPQQPDRNTGSGMTSAADLAAILAERRKQVAKESGMADGGMVRHRFDGKGGPRGDQIPVTVAGEKIKVSDGEEAVILPAKTAANPQAVQAIGQIIQQSNDGRAPAMGIEGGGRYAVGAAPHIVDPRGQIYINGRPAGLLNAPPDPVRTDFTVDSSGNARGANQPGSSVGQYRGPGTAVANYVPSAQPRPYDIAKPAPRGMAYDAGRTAGAAYQNVGGISGAVGKLANIAVPAIAAAQTFGDDGIKVMGNRSSDPNYDETAGLPRVASSLKEAALRAGDFGTKGLDILGGWALPKGEASFNDAYRQGVGQLEGVSAPTSQQIAAASEQQQSKGNYSNEGRPSGILASNGPSPDLSQRVESITHPSGAVEVNMGRGFDPTKLTMAPGTGMISNAAGRTMILNDMSPNQYVGADGKPGQTWEKTAQYADAMRRAQADRERLARTLAENAVGDLASPRPDVRATAERQLQAIGQVQGIESQSLAQAGQRQAVEANNPAVAQQLAQQRVGIGELNLQKEQELNALYAAHRAASPEDQPAIAEQIRVRADPGSKRSEQEQYDNIIVKEYDQTGTVIGERIEQRPKNRAAAAAGSPAANNGLPAPKSIAERDKLPSGTKYVAPDGQIRIKP